MPVTRRPGHHRLLDHVLSPRSGPRDRPAEAGQLTRDGDRDERAPLAALLIEPAPGAVKALLGLPGDRDHVGGLARLALCELAARPLPKPVVPGRLDQQGGRGARARLGDRAQAPLVSGRVLRRHRAEVAHQLARATEALEVADLGAEPDCREGVDPAGSAAWARARTRA